MAAYLLLNATTPFFTPNTIVPPATDGPIPPVVIAPEQAFQLTIQGGGAISATIQVLASNDRVNWVSYGDPVTLSGTTNASVGFGGNQNYGFYSAILPAISGAGTVARLVMNG